MTEPTGKKVSENPEVVEKAARRRFTTEYKQRIVMEADQCSQRENDQCSQRENDRLSEKLRQAELIIDVQKKVSELMQTKSPEKDD